MKVQSNIVNQKGANGIIAEYSCAFKLVEILKGAGISVLPPSETEHLDNMHASIQRVGNELNDSQVRRAIQQGEAIAFYIFDSLWEDPTIIGIDWSSDLLRESRFIVQTVGSDTTKGDSADLTITAESPDKQLTTVNVSLKAYRGSQSSMGSNSGKKALERLFAKNGETLSDLGESGIEFINTQKLLRSVATEFYNESQEGVAFLNEYRKRKNKPDAKKPNNPYRRKELKAYCMDKHSLNLSHEFAGAFLRTFNENTQRLSTLSIDSEDRKQYKKQLKEILGLEDDVITLNAVKSTDSITEQARIINSNVDGTYGKIKRALENNYLMHLSRAKEDVADLKVNLENDNGDNVRGLSLSVWMDGTIQFKIKVEDTQDIGEKSNR